MQADEIQPFVNRAEAVEIHVRDFGRPSGGLPTVFLGRIVLVHDKHVLIIPVSPRDFRGDSTNGWMLNAMWLPERFIARIMEPLR